MAARGGQAAGGDREFAVVKCPMHGSAAGGQGTQRLTKCETGIDWSDSESSKSPRMSSMRSSSKRVASAAMAFSKWRGSDWLRW